jgi:hypothetical protein
MGQAREKLFEAAIRETTAAVVAAQTAEFAELRRILGDQGDASDQVTEVLGRMLARLSGEVEALVAEIVRLHERLDSIEALP